MKNKNQILEQYRHFRARSRRIQDRLVKKLPKGALEACGTRLGVLEESKLYLDEDEVPLFFDYCLYHGRTGEHNTIEAARAEDLYAPGSEDRSVLEIMSQASPALFEVEGTDVGYGITAYDVLREQEIFVMDQGLSHTVRAGLVMGANLMPLGEVFVTSGAAFLLDEAALAQVEDALEAWEERVGEIDWRALSAARSDRLATILVQAALEHGVMSRMRYVDEGELRVVMRGGKPRRGQWKKR